MTLEQYLKKHKKGGLKVHAKNGASFIYCDYINEHTLEELQKISFHYLLDAKDRLQKARKKLLAETQPTKVASLERKVAKLGLYLDTFEPLLSRNIIEVYKATSLDEPNTNIVVVSGSEIGSYWFINEYRLKKERRTKGNVKR